MYFVPSILNKLWQCTGLLTISRSGSAQRQDKQNRKPCDLQWNFKLYLLSAAILGVTVVLAVKDIRHYYHVWRNEDIRQFCLNNTQGHYPFRYRSSVYPTSIPCTSVDEITFMKILNYLLLTTMVALGIIELNLNFENQIQFYQTVENFQDYFQVSLD